MDNNKAIVVRWSRKYDACVECGTRDRPHSCRGYCDRCIQRVRQHWKTMQGRQSRKLWCDKNKEQIKAKQKHWRDDNKDFLREYNKEYYRNNWWDTNQAGKLGGSIQEIRKLPHHCERCGDTRLYVLQSHHIDGNHDNNSLTNIQILCANCHCEVHYGALERRKHG